MSAFPDWQQFAVHQRREKTGCIPAGYEMILRAAGALGVDFDSFQDDFDLEKDIPDDAPRVNHFGSVANAVSAKYPEIRFAFRTFPKNDGAGKLAFIEEQLAQRRPVLVSINNVIFSCAGWHIMPVVDIDKDNLVLLAKVTSDGRCVLVQLPKPVLVGVHEQYPGGEEVAWLASC